jgi:hypothetical protein
MGLSVVVDHDYAGEFEFCGTNGAKRDICLSDNSHLATGVNVADATENIAVAIDVPAHAPNAGADDLIFILAAHDNPFPSDNRAVLATNSPANVDPLRMDALRAIHVVRCQIITVQGAWTVYTVGLQTVGTCDGAERIYWTACFHVHIEFQIPRDVQGVLAFPIEGAGRYSR